MIHLQLKEFQQLNRDVTALTFVLIGLLCLVFIRVATFIYVRQYEQLWGLLTPATSLVAALVIVRTAARLLVSGYITREDDRRQEIVRTTHHSIAITKDLYARINYCKKILIEGGRPAITLIQIAKTIEDRYETLLKPEGYKYLPGECVDLITGLSGNIFGIGFFAESVKHHMTANPTAALPNLPSKNGDALMDSLDRATSDLQKIIDILFKLRDSLDVPALRCPASQ